MNPVDIAFYGHQFLQQQVEDLPPAGWVAPDACGTWSVKDILAHLRSYEQVLAEILSQMTDPTAPTPRLDRMRADGEAFNREAIAALAGHSPDEVWTAYESAFQIAQEKLARISAETWHARGILAWYGPTYDLEDFLVYTFYGHKREHGAQIAVVKDHYRRGMTGQARNGN